jgi:hypothetical protein
LATYITPEIDRTFQKVLTRLRQDKGRTIVIKYQSAVPTEADSGAWDPINNEPVDPSASPDYTDGTEDVSVHNVIIHYGPEDNPYLHTTGGRLDQAEARLSMKLEDVLVDKTDKNGLTYFDGAREVIVDGKTYHVKGKPIPTGLGELFSLVVIVKLVE